MFQLMQHPSKPFFGGLDTTENDRMQLTDCQILDRVARILVTGRFPQVVTLVDIALLFSA